MSLCQLQTWVVDTQFGLPRKLRKRDNHRSESEIEVPPVVPLACDGTLAAEDRVHSSGDIIECLVPTDSLPTGIRIVLRTSPFQRVIQTIRMIDPPGAALPLMHITPPFG